MNQFISAPLGKVCERITVGHVGKTSPYYRDSGIPFLRTQNVGEGELLLDNIMFVTTGFHEKLKKSQVRDGDVLISRVISDQVNCAVVPKNFGEANCANVILIRPGENVDPNYLVRYISSPIAQRQLLRNRVGSAQSVVNTKVVSAWTVPLPPLAEQRRIAAILDKADAIRRKRKQAIQYTEELLRATFLDMFGDPVTNPKGWEVKDVGQVANVTKLAGFEYTKYIKYQENGEIIVVRALNVKNGALKLNDVKFISKETSQLLPRSQLFRGDVVMTYIGVNIGDVAIIEENDKYHLAPNVAKITPGEEVDSIFLMHSLSFQKSQLDKYTTNTAKQALNMSKIREISLPIPPLYIQEKFRKVVGDIQNLRTQTRGSTSESELLFGSLLQRAFRGEL